MACFQNIWQHLSNVLNFQKKYSMTNMMLRCKKMVYLRGIFYLSPFFAIKIINIITNIQSDNRLSASLYVDDFQIRYRHFDLAVIGSKLQVIDTLTDCNFHNEFKFSEQNFYSTFFRFIRTCYPPNSQAQSLSTPVY